MKRWAVRRKDRDSVLAGEFGAWLLYGSARFDKRAEALQQAIRLSSAWPLCWFGVYEVPEIGFEDM